MIWGLGSGVLWVGAARAEPPCSFFVDDAEVVGLDCAAGGAWSVSCPIPAGPSGRVRLRASAPELGLVAQARVPLTQRGSVRVAIAGPGGRAGGFVVDQPGAGLLPGQAVGPNQWCPVVNTGGSLAPPLQIEVTIHQQTGFAEEVLDGGVVNRVPVYDAGQVFASGRAAILQRPPGPEIPILTGPIELPPETTVRGQLQLAGADGRWRSMGWSGRLRTLPVEGGPVEALVLDFVAPEVGAVSGADPVDWVLADLQQWLSGDLTSRIGRAGWARSGFEPPLQLTFGPPDSVGAGIRTERRGDRTWIRASDPNHDLRVGLFGDRLRVVLASRASAPLDAAAWAAIDDASTWDL